MKFWIAHPTCDQAPVSIWRWAAYHVAQWLAWRARQLERWAIKDDDEIPF